MSESINISKLDAAKRELEYSIRLFFSSGDPIVLHLLISSSQQILRDLCRSRNMNTLIDDLIKSVRSDKQNYVRGKLRAVYNFLHHADKDPNGIIEFFPESNDYALWEAIDMYSRLTGEKTGIMLAFSFWFNLKNPELLLEENDKNQFKQANTQIDVNDKRLFLKFAEELETKRIA